MLRQVVTWKSLTCYVKLVVLTRELHVMQRDMGGVRTDVTVGRVKMLHVPLWGGQERCCTKKPLAEHANI